MLLGDCLQGGRALDTGATTSYDDTFQVLVSSWFRATFGYIYRMWVWAKNLQRHQNFRKKRLIWQVSTAVSIRGTLLCSKNKVYILPKTWIPIHICDQFTFVSKNGRLQLLPQNGTLKRRRSPPVAWSFRKPWVLVGETQFHLLIFLILKWFTFPFLLVTMNPYFYRFSHCFGCFHPASMALFVRPSTMALAVAAAAATGCSLQVWWETGYRLDMMWINCWTRI